MKISTISYSFVHLTRAGMMDIFGYLETCKYRLGLQAADIWNGTLTGTDEEYTNKIKEALAEREMTVACLAVDWAHVWEDDVQAREANYEKALAHLHMAEMLGAKTVRIDPGGPRDKDTFTSEQFDWIVKRFREYAQRAHDNGYIVGPENHWGPSNHFATMKKICEAVDHPGFGILLHVGKKIGPDPEAEERSLARWAMHTHLPGTLSESELLAEMTMLRDTGYQGYWSVEGGSSGAGAYTGVSLRLALVRDILERWRMGKS